MYVGIPPDLSLASRVALEYQGVLAPAGAINFLTFLVPWQRIRLL